MSDAKNTVQDVVKEILTERKLDTKYGIDESKTNTNLVSKHYSPLCMVCLDGYWTRIFVAVIADPNLDDLYHVVRTAYQSCLNLRGYDTIQSLRDMSGVISETVVKYYNLKKANTVEGVGVVVQRGDVIVSSLYGDFMNHLACRLEFYELFRELSSHKSQHEGGAHQQRPFRLQTSHEMHYE